VRLICGRQILNIEAIAVEQQKGTALSNRFECGCAVALCKASRIDDFGYSTTQQNKPAR